MHSVSLLLASAGAIALAPAALAIGTPGNGTHRHGTGHTGPRSHGRFGGSQNNTRNGRKSRQFGQAWTEEHVAAGAKPIIGQSGFETPQMEWVTLTAGEGGRAFSAPLPTLFAAEYSALIASIGHQTRTVITGAVPTDIASKASSVLAGAGLQSGAVASAVSSQITAAPVAASKPAVECVSSKKIVTTRHAGSVVASKVSKVVKASTTEAQVASSKAVQVVETTTASAPKASSTSVYDLATVQSQALSSHNSLRAEKGANALVWHSTLADAAHAWASKCVFQDGGLDGAGSNVAASTSHAATVDSEVAMWTAEASQYNTTTFTYSHYTQMVWKVTTDIGCAMVACDPLSFPSSSSYQTSNYLSCLYYPEGNVYPNSNFLKNVQSP